ncbi:MAG: GNAT family protein [bacterium]
MNDVQADVVVRRVEAHEDVVYRAVRLECLQLYPANFGTTLAEALSTPRTPFENFIAEQNPDNVMFGAFVDGTLGGLCGFHREPRQRARHRGELIQMYVAPRLAKRGIGGRLIAAVLDHAFENPGIRHVVLSVVADNTTAIRAYERAGFREYGRLEGYFLSENGASTQLWMVRERD